MLGLAAPGNSPVHSSIGTPSGARPRGGGPPSDRSGASGFRFSFTPLTGVLFTVPSRYLHPLSVAKSTQPWRVGPPASRGISRVPRYSRPDPPQTPPVAHAALTLCGRPFQAVWLGRDFLQLRGGPCRSARWSRAQPRPGIGRQATQPGAVWAGPVSLAATPGVDFSFLSSGY